LLRFVVCDDEIRVYKQINEYLRYYCIQNNREYEVAYCATAQELLDMPFNYNFLFLDIMLDGGSDGIDVGKQLRAAGNTALFIIVTIRQDRTLDGYEATVFRYLVKPFKREDICRILDAAIETIEFDKQIIATKFKYETSYVHVKDIIYVESYLRKRYITTKERRYDTTATWKALMTQFSEYPCFFSPKNTYLVNLAHVTGQSKVGITMSDGTKIRFAAGKYEQFLFAFSDFLNSRG